MRLLDHITQHATPLLVATETPGTPPRLVRLPGALEFAPQISSCPLRYVLGDDLTAACAELSLADGDRLSSCLDLIHLPGTSFWIEWNDVARARAVAGHVGGGPPSTGPHLTKVGALVTASSDGRRGTLRTFWLDSDGRPCLAPLETHLSLDCHWPPVGPLPSVLDGGFARVRAADDPGLDELLDCMRFRYDARWAQYYREAQLDAPALDQLLRSSLASVARDMPLVLAFALLLGAHNATRARRVDCQRLNRRRQQRNKRPLLEHLEVSCRIDLDPAEVGTAGVGSGRRAPRLHHVRGHLVRRADEIYWRKTHVRGRLTLGQVRSRTVKLSFGAARATPLNA